MSKSAKKEPYEADELLTTTSACSMRKQSEAFAPCETVSRGRFCSYCGRDLSKVLAARVKWKATPTSVILDTVLSLATEALDASDGNEEPLHELFERDELVVLIEEARTRFEDAP